MRTIAVFLFLTVLASLPGDLSVPSATAQYGGAARVWIENDREYFRHGDRLRVNFSTAANSYVAVVHIDPSGNLDFVYPRSPWDSEFVRAGRIHSLDRSGWGNGLLVRGGSGIGYLYVIASPVPLDYSRFRAGPGSHWDWSYAGRSVAGDPFWAMEQLTRTLLPRWGNAPYAVDYYTYFVGGIHRYPSYACADRGYGSGWGWGYSSAWSSYYGSCDRLDYFLRDNPYYFDSRRFRGDRRSYYRDYDDRDWDPRHVFKEDPDRSGARPGPRVQSQPSSGGTSRVTPQGSSPATPLSRPVQRAAPERSEVSPAPAREAAPRPAARPTSAPVERERARPAPEPRPREATPQRAQPAPQPRPEARPRQAAPQRAQPAPSPRPEPRARSAPARSDGGGRSATPAASRSSGSADRGSTTSTPRSRRDD